MQHNSLCPCSTGIFFSQYYHYYACLQNSLNSLQMDDQTSKPELWFWLLVVNDNLNWRCQIMLSLQLKERDKFSNHKTSMLDELQHQSSKELHTSSYGNTISSHMQVSILLRIHFYELQIFSIFVVGNLCILFCSPFDERELYSLLIDE